MKLDELRAQLRTEAERGDDTPKEQLCARCAWRFVIGAGLCAPCMEREAEASAAVDGLGGAIVVGSYPRFTMTKKTARCTECGEGFTVFDGDTEVICPPCLIRIDAEPEDV